MQVAFHNALIPVQLCVCRKPWPVSSVTCSCASLPVICASNLATTQRVGSALSFAETKWTCQNSSFFLTHYDDPTHHIDYKINKILCKGGVWWKRPNLKTKQNRTSNFSTSLPCRSDLHMFGVSAHATSLAYYCASSMCNIFSFQKSQNVLGFALWC